MTRMTRLGLLGAMAVASVVFAQAPAESAPPPVSPEVAPEVSPPPPPPPVLAPIAEPAPTPGPALADRTQTPQRYSRFSAGRGGPLFGFSEFLAGMIGGGFLGGSVMGNSLTGVRQGIYVGAVVGGLLLGGLGVGVQYIHPIGLASAGTVALATGVGGLFGVGLAAAIGANDPTIPATLLLAGTQVGALVALLALWNVDDLNGEDLALMGMTTLYGFVLAGLVTMIAAGNNPSPPAWPLLMSPALGMGLGALWALAVDMSPGRVLKLTALPAGVGLILLYLGLLPLQADPQLVGITTLAGVVATFGLTYIFTMDDDAPKGKPTAGLQAMPTIAVMPAGRRNEAVAAGPGMVFTF